MNKTILFISPGASVTNRDEGDLVRTYNLADQLSKRGWDVHILEQGETKGNHNFTIRKFRDLTPHRMNDLNPFLYISILKILKKVQPCIIHVKSLSGEFASKSLCYTLRADGTVIYDAQNFEREKIKQDSNPNLPFYKRVLAPKLIPAIERLAVVSSDHAITVSEDDKQKFMSAYSIGADEISLIPSGTHIDRKLGKSSSKIRKSMGIDSGSTVILFHGTYSYTPNREAIEQIEQYLSPAFEQYEDVVFVIAGKGVPIKQQDNINYVGFVDDLDSLLHTADIAVVPLKSGGGTKLKMFDYMGAGLPIVTTEKGAEGIRLEDKKHAFISSEIGPEMIENIKRCFDSECAQMLGQNARELAAELYSWEKIGENLDVLYQNLLSDNKS